MSTLAREVDAWRLGGARTGAPERAIASVLRARCEAQGVTVREAAAVMGVAPLTASLWLSGARPILLDALWSLCERLGCWPSEVIGVSASLV